MNNVPSKPLLLCILDGLGARGPAADNAVSGANAAFLHALTQEYPSSLLRTSGEAVGLPEGQMGNSEVGHMTIGLGRVMMQSLPKISAAARNGSLKAHPLLKECVRILKTSGNAAHLAGLLSEGGVHSHQDQIFDLADIFADEGISVFLHMFTDGRDVPPGSAGASLRAASERANRRRDGLIRLNSLSGRFYAMDRDGRSERLKAAVDAILRGAEGAPVFDDPLRYLQDQQTQGITDEFILPAAASGALPPRDGDALILCNFRADRMRQLTAALASPEGGLLPGLPRPAWSTVISFTEYDAGFSGFCNVLFPPEETQGGFGEVISAHGLRQLRIAETEKYAHVTFFFSGGREEPFPGERRILVPSPKVRTYDEKPEMSAFEVTDALLNTLDEIDVAVLNFANPDMVGHTGSYAAAVKAVEAVDACLARIIPAVLARGGAAFITADHGNVEQMTDPETGEPHTQHTTLPVPLIYVSTAGRLASLAPEGTLADIAPTMLAHLGLAASPHMSGKNLLKG